MIRVLFVCLGNICRSPMAEAIFRHDVQEAGLADRIQVDSAGTGDWHIGNPPHQGTREILSSNQISYEGIKARQVDRADFTNFDYIIAMDMQNLHDLEKIREKAESSKEKKPYIGRLMDFASQHENSDVPDPYYTGNFAEVYEMVKDGCRGLLNHIQNHEEL